MLVPGFRKTPLRSFALDEAVYTKMLGSKPEPGAQAEIMIQETERSPWGRFLRLNATVTLRSGNMKREIPFEFKMDKNGLPVSSGYDASGPAIFKIAYRNMIEELSPMGITFFGEIRNAKGEALLAALEINMTGAHGSIGSGRSGSSIGLYFFDQDGRHSLFR